MYYKKLKSKIDNIENGVYQTMESIIKGNCKKETYNIMENILWDIKEIKSIINNHSIKESSK